MAQMFLKTSRTPLLSKSGTTLSRGLNRGHPSIGVRNYGTWGNPPPSPPLPPKSQFANRIAGFTSLGLQIPGETVDGRITIAEGRSSDSETEDCTVVPESSSTKIGISATTLPSVKQSKLLPPSQQWTVVSGCSSSDFEADSSSGEDSTDSDDDSATIQKVVTSGLLPTLRPNRSSYSLPQFWNSRPVPIRNINPFTTSVLNGNNGSFTNTDDHSIASTPYLPYDQSNKIFYDGCELFEGYSTDELHRINSHMSSLDGEELVLDPVVPVTLHLGSTTIVLKSPRITTSDDIINSVITYLTLTTFPSFYLKFRGKLIEKRTLFFLAEWDDFYVHLCVVGGRNPKSKSSKGRKSTTIVSVRQQTPWNHPRKPKKKAPRQERKKESHPRARSARGSRLYLEPCTHKYLIASTNAFSPKALGVCNPAGTERYTYQAHSVNRWLANVGTSGLGWILVSPSIASNGICAFYTTPTYTGTTYASPFSAANTLNTGVNSITPNILPFNVDTLVPTTTQDQPLVMGRVVTIGLRSTYVGTELNLGGMYYALMDPIHNSTSGMYAAAMSYYGELVSVPITRKPLDMSFTSLFPWEDCMSYSNPAATASNGTTGTSGFLVVNPWSTTQNWATTYGGTTTYYYANPGTTAAVEVGTPPLVLLFSGASGNGFNMEYIQHVEYTGQSAQSMQTLTRTDPQGAAQVKAAVQEALVTATTDTGMNRSDRVYSYAVRILGDMAAQAVKVAVPMVMDRIGM
jgi:hypothetical protein